MRNVGRAFGLGIVILVGCADATFDLLPKKAGTGANGIGQSGDNGTGDTGSGDATSTGGTGASAGFGARGGAGGSMDIGMGGAGNDTNCGPSGCAPNTCTPGQQGCCNTDGDCAAPTAYCSTLGRCVNCRPINDCPYGENCSHDCLMGETCDWATNVCAPDCRTKPCSSGFLRVCEPKRLVCVECDPKNPMSCEHDLHCHYTGQCVECLSSYDCHDEAKPVCDFETSDCGPCTNDNECNPGGTGFGRTCDTTSGRCVTSTPTPAPTPPPSP